MVSKVEEWKDEKDPIEIKDTILNEYAEEGFEAIEGSEDDNSDEFERLKWYGLYKHNDNAPGYFMHRVKVPNGIMTAEQARRVGEVVKEYAVGEEPNPHFGKTFLDVTTRQDLQIHWVDIQDIEDIWNEWEDVGLPAGATGACGDVFRNIVGCPVAGVDAEEVVDASGLVDESADFFMNSDEFTNLPRKFKVSISGCKEGCGQGEINDIGMIPAVKEIDGERVEGFNVMAGGGLGRGGIMAKDMDVFVTPDEVLEFNRAAATVFREQGNREQRARARLRYKIEDEGVEWFRNAVEEEADIDLRSSGDGFKDEETYNDGSHYCDHVGIHEQKNGKYYAGLQVITGRCKADWFIEAADLAEEYGNGEIRLTQRQNIIITGIDEDDLDEFRNEPLLDEMPVDPSPFRRGAISCTGTEFCNLALIETKNRMVDWIKQLEDRVEVDSPLRVHLSGCNASCAQPQIADIGFQGSKSRKGDEIVGGQHRTRRRSGRGPGIHRVGRQGGPV
ncbi:MAG: ferredoxin--nitrite reductase [Halobacteria archaeon]|nr:ferredoxin--nitrite reductase [Halobacteria archaeon]